MDKVFDQQRVTFNKDIERILEYAIRSVRDDLASASRNVADHERAIGQLSAEVAILRGRCFTFGARIAELEAQHTQGDKP